MRTWKHDRLYQEKHKAYVEHVAPADALEEDLVKNLAWACVKLDRARRQEVAGRKRLARRKWEVQRLKEVKVLRGSAGDGADGVVLGAGGL